MIPRAVHQVWLGPRPVPLRWTEQWRFAGWEYRLWREEDIHLMRPGLANRAAYDWYLRSGCWHGASDVARVEILLRHGGVFADADAEPTRPWDAAPFMGLGFFAAHEVRDDEPGRVANGIIGAEAGHPVLARYAELIGLAPSLEPPWRAVGGTLLTRAVAEAGDPSAILPEGAFYPVHHTGRLAAPADNWAVQHWATTLGGYA